MIGARVGGLAGGFIAESLGFSFEVGAMIGSIVGGIVAGQIYKVASAATLATKANTVAQTAHQKGVMGERYISKTTGYAKNTRMVDGTNRIPDFYKKGNYLIESKNVIRQGLTGQLKDYMTIAGREGIQMELYVRQTTILSKALRNSGIIIRFFPW